MPVAVLRHPRDPSCSVIGTSRDDALEAEQGMNDLAEECGANMTLFLVTIGPPSHVEARDADFCRCIKPTSTKCKI